MTGFPDLTQRRTSLLTGFVLSLLVALVYVPTLSYGFLNWDDDRVLVENPAVISPDGLGQIWSTLELPKGFPNYPLVYTTYWLERRLWGLNPLGYHAGNIVLHALNTFLVFIAVLSLGFSRRAALVAAALFGLHPTQVESVAWIAERKNVLSATFYWAAFIAYLRGREPAARHYYWLSIALFAAALLSKTATIVLPLSLLLADRIRARRWTTESLVRIAPMFGLATLAALQTMHAENLNVTVPLIERPVIAGRALWTYARQLVAPTELLPVYPRWEIHLEQLGSWVPLAATLLAAAAATRVASRHVQWGLGHFACTLLPVLGLVSYGFNEYSFVADRNLYLACVGPFAIFGAGVDLLAQRTRPMLTDLFAAAVCASLALLTLQQIPVWRSSESLWRATINGNPNAGVANSNLGLALTESGRVADAMPYLLRAVELTPNSSEAQTNLALALYRSERFAEAEVHCRHALRLSPDLKYRKNLALALQAQHKQSEAETEIRRAVMMHPADAELRVLLGNTLIEQGRLAESVPELNAALEVEPGSLPLRTQIGRVYLALDKGDEAASAFATVAERQPRSVEALYNLALAYAKIGRSEKALHELERLIEIQPDFLPAETLRQQLLSQISVR